MGKKQAKRGSPKKAAAGGRSRRRWAVWLLVPVALAAFALLWRARSGPDESPAGPPERRPNVLVVTIDTLRADYLGSYGGRAAATPHLDRLASQGVRFQTAVAQAPLTLPSHASIFTGLFPLTTGIRDNLGYVLTESHLTLAEILRSRGYRTGAFVGAYVLHSKWGLAQGFDRYDDQFEDSGELTAQWGIERRGDQVAAAAGRWLQEEAAGPFFAWIHLFDPHDPYNAPEPFRSQYAQDPYAGEVAYTDQVVGELLAGLERLGVYEDTVIVVLGDHGEGLGQHGEPTHGLYLYDSTLLVPFLVKLPGRESAGRVIEEPVQLVDVLPTLLQILKLERPDNLQGQGLLGLILGKESARSVPAYAETFYPNEFGWSELRAWRTPEHKYILGPQPELYALSSDPGELTNLIEGRQALADQYQAALESFETRYRDDKAAASAQAEVSVEDLERFRALGYIGGPSRPKESRELSLPDPKQKIEEFNLVSRAMTLMAERRYEEAASDLRALIGREPGMATAHSMLGQCYLQSGRFEQARAIFENVVRDAPDRVYPLFYLGLSHYRLRDYGKSLPLLEKVARLDPQFFPVQNYLGLIYADQNRIEEAVAAFSRAVRLKENAQSYQMLGLLFLQKKQPEQALSALEQAARLDAQNAIIRMYLAQLYAQKGEEAKARNAYQEALRLDPEIEKKLR